MQMPDRPRIELFEGLPDETVCDLLAAAQLHPVGPDTVLFREGSAACSVHVLASGFVRMAQTTAAGARVILRYAEAGETFGMAALTSSSVHPADAITVTASVEMQWPAQRIRDLLRNQPRAGLNAVAELEARLREMECRLRELSNEAVERRVAHAILRLVRKLGQQAGDKVEIPFPFARQDLADLTGTTLHTVSRTLGAWERQGLIRSGRQRIAVANLDGLAALAAAENAGDAAPRRTHRRMTIPSSGIKLAAR